MYFWLTDQKIVSVWLFVGGVSPVTGRAGSSSPENTCAGTSCSDAAPIHPSSETTELYIAETEQLKIAKQVKTNQC